MSEYIDVVEHNPIVFVKKVCEAIADGYTVTNDIAGYPSFSPYCQVRLFKSDSDSVVVPASWGDELVLSDYDGMKFMITLSAAVKGGWRFVEGGDHYFDALGLKTIQLSRSVKAEAVPEPVPQPEAKPKTGKQGKQGKQNTPPKKALVAEPTITEMETTNDQQAE